MFNCDFKNDPINIFRHLTYTKNINISCKRVGVMTLVIIAQSWFSDIGGGMVAIVVMVIVMIMMVVAVFET